MPGYSSTLKIKFNSPLIVVKLVKDMQNSGINVQLDGDWFDYRRQQVPFKDDKRKGRVSAREQSLRSIENARLRQPTRKRIVFAIEGGTLAGSIAETGMLVLSKTKLLNNTSVDRILAFFEASNLIKESEVYDP